MAAVDGLFNDRKDVFGVDLNLALFQHRHGKRLVVGPNLTEHGPSGSMALREGSPNSDLAKSWLG